MTNKPNPRIQSLNPLHCPACTSCGHRTRFVGLEAIPNDDNTDLCTYECLVCGQSQVARVPRAHGDAMHGAIMNGAAAGQLARA